MRCADGPDFLAARHRLATTHENAAKMPIERVDVFDRAVLPISVPHNDHVSPAHVTVARENHHAGADTANRVPKIGVSAANSIPIFTEMSIRPETARFVVTLGIRYPQGKIEAVREFGKRRLRSQADGLSRDRILLARCSVQQLRTIRRLLRVVLSGA